jgi:hypothetical protein
MTCCGCRQTCPMSANGLCLLCREDRRRPQQWRRMRVCARERWTEGENAVLLRRYNLTERQAVDRSLLALMEMQKLFSRELIFANGLDNPYMQEHARRTVAGYVLAAQIRQGKRKPVARAVAEPATRKKAA